MGSYKLDKSLAIFLLVKRTIRIFYCASFRSKIWPCHSLRWTRFPIRRVYFHYPMTFSAYIWCFVHNFIWLCDLSPWPSTFWPWRTAVSDELRFWHIQRTYQFLTFYGYPILSYVRLNQITLPLPGKVTAHAACHVTYHRGQKWSTFLKSLNPIYLFTLSISGSYDED